MVWSVFVDGLLNLFKFWYCDNIVLRLKYRKWLVINMIKRGFGILKWIKCRFKNLNCKSGVFLNLEG